MTNDALRREIVRREESEEDLRASREDLAALFEASPVSIIDFDQNGIVRSWNAAAERIFGWRAAEVIGRKSPTVPADLQDQNARLVEQTLTGVTHSDVESQGIRKDGTRIDVSLSMAPLRDAAGVPRGYVSIVSDMTGRKGTEAELRSSRERLRALSARVLLIQEEERTRIARELHDDLAQLLTAIKMGLVAAIEKKLVEFQERTEIECELSIRPEELNIPAPVATAVFRILEEALTNIVRHSAATRAEVRLRQQENELLLEVRDNGRGIRDEELLAQDSHGVIGMKERADLLGGSLTINGIHGRGTIVVARIPLDGRYGSNSGTHR
jgi:two-component system sensor histidine kinase UhpB